MRYEEVKSPFGYTIAREVREAKPILVKQPEISIARRISVKDKVLQEYCLKNKRNIETMSLAEMQAAFENINNR